MVSPTTPCSGCEPAVRLFNKSNIIGGRLPSLTYARRPYARNACTRCCTPFWTIVRVRWALAFRWAGTRRKRHWVLGLCAALGCRLQVSVLCHSAAYWSWHRASTCSCGQANQRYPQLFDRGTVATSERSGHQPGLRCSGFCAASHSSPTLCRQSFDRTLRCPVSLGGPVQSFRPWEPLPTQRAAGRARQSSLSPLLLMHRKPNPACSEPDPAVMASLYSLLGGGWLRPLMLIVSGLNLPVL